MPSPIFYRDQLTLIKNGGLISSFDARTGKPFYTEERIDAIGDYYASPVAANGKICVCSQAGLVTIIQAGPELNILAKNDLHEAILASPGIVDDTLYIRTIANLYAFRIMDPR